MPYSVLASVINYTPRVTLRIVLSLNDKSRDIIYDRTILIGFRDLTKYLKVTFVQPPICSTQWLFQIGDQIYSSPSGPKIIASF